MGKSLYGQKTRCRPKEYQPDAPFLPEGMLPNLTRWNRPQRGTKLELHDRSIRERREFMHTKTPDANTRRLRWIKNRHEMWKLRKKFPEIDWDRPDRETKAHASLKRLVAGRAAKKKAKA